MKKEKLPPKSMIFYQLYAVNILITVVFIGLIAIICSLFSSRLILDNLIDFNEGMIEAKSDALDERVKQLDDTVNLMVEDENVFKFLISDDDYYARPTALLAIIRHFQNVCSNSGLVEGVCLVDEQRGIALTEKTKLDIPRELPFKTVKGRNAFVVMDTDEGQRLGMIKHFEPVSGERNMYIVLTIDETAFTENLLNGNLPEVVQFYLLTKEEEVLSADGWGGVEPEVKERLIRQEGDIEEIEYDQEKLVLYKTPSKISDLSFVAVQNYTYLENEASSVKRIIILVSILMILAATVIIYLFSLYVYRPLKQLGYKLQGMTVRKQPETVKNEYRLIENVVNELQLEKEYAMPSVIRDSIEKLLTEIFDEERFEHLKRLLRQDMKYDWYVLTLIDCEDASQKDTVINCFNRFIWEEDEIEGFFTGITAKRCVGILNTCLDYGRFVGKIEELKGRMEEEAEIRITCCVSRGFQNRENMCLVFSEMLATLEKKFFRGDSALIYEAAPMERDKTEACSREIENRLMRYVTEGRREEAIEALHTLTKNLSNSATDIQYTKFVYFQICNSMVKNVRELGGRLPKDYNEKELFGAVFGKESILHLEELAEEILKTCIQNFEQKEKALSANVEKAIGFIKANYMRDLSLEDVANAVFLSSGYLSIIFKEETGCTVLEYITYIRMQKARELVLQIPALKVKEIAEQLGYNNVQSFIRYFKKYYGVTPMSYRKHEGIEK